MLFCDIIKKESLLVWVGGSPGATGQYFPPRTREMEMQIEQVV